MWNMMHVIHSRQLKCKPTTVLQSLWMVIAQVILACIAKSPTLETTTARQQISTRINQQKQRLVHARMGTSHGGDKAYCKVFKVAWRVDNWNTVNTSETDLLIVFSLLTTLRQTKPRCDQGCNLRSNGRVFGMSCILYRLTQLAAFFLDQRAEWSTTNSCYCLLN